MATTPRHRIKRAVFDLRFPDEAVAFDVRRRLESLFERTVAPALETVFDARAPNGIEHRIDRIEIDLGTLDPDRLDETHLGALIAAQVDRELGRITAAREVVARSESQTAADTLVTFLERGRFPWQAEVTSLTELEAALRAIDTHELPVLADRLHRSLRRHDVRARLAHQLDAGFFAWILARLEPHLHETLDAIMTTLSLRRPLAQVRLAALTVIARTPRGALTAVIARSEMLMRLTDSPAPAVEDGKLTPIPDTAPLDTTPPDTAPLDATPPDAPPGIATIDTPLEKSLDTPPDVALDRPLIDDSETDTTEPVGAVADAMYVAGAGVVMLHPFLLRFFDALQLLDDEKRFRSGAATVEAIHLLHHLVTGAEHPEEHQTTLYKVLCAYPVDAPLVRRLDIGERARAESETLLDAVIDHWSKLKRTSPSALRETFLQRDGRLTSTEESWNLVLERRGVDVLLDTLPWSLSPVRLPWMDRTLWVEWA